MGYVFLKLNNKPIGIRKKFAYYDPDDPSRITWHAAELSDFAYSHFNSSRALVKGYKNTQNTSVLIPENIDGSPVEIGYNWPYNNLDNTGTMVNIMLSDTTFGGIHIESSTLRRFFGENSAITYLYIDCDALTILDIDGCSSINTIGIHSSELKTLPDLYNMTQITSLSAAFTDCSSLTDLSSWTIPPNVTNINQAFRRCTNLEKAPILDRSFTAYGVAFGGTSCTDVTITDLNFNPQFSLFDATGTTYTGNTYIHRVYLDSAYYAWYRQYELKGGRDVNYHVIELLDTTPKRIVFYGDSYLNYETNNLPNPDHGMIVPYLGEATGEKKVELCNYAVGGSGSVSAQQFFDRHNDRYNLPTVIWLGQNDIGYEPATTIANIQGMIDKLSGDYIVLGMLQYNWTEARNSAFAEAFGSHYYDPRDYLMQNCWDIIGKTPTDEEEAQIANNQMPLIFFGTEAVPHPHVWACQIVSKMLYDIFMSRGWLTSADTTTFGQNTATTILATTLAINAGSTGTLSATSANGEPITWVSTDETVATVSGGVVTGVSAGSCYVVARAGYYSKFCTVTVS